MKFSSLCASCIVKQVPLLAEINKIDDKTEKETLRKVLSFFATADYSKSTPELVGGAWDIMTEQFGERDLYRSVKYSLNKKLLTISENIEKQIKDLSEPEQKFRLALCSDIAGNLIDFAASDSLNFDTFEKKLEEVQNTKFGVDDSNVLYEKLKTAKTVLWLGDNCGEIALDKMFAKVVKELFPNVNIFYTVRGMAVMNDVTLVDAEDVDMSSVATVITNGDKSAGTVLDCVSQEFKDLFFAADVVISKGQGNFEGLYYPPRKDIFFLYMAKCSVTAKMADVPVKSIVCKGF